MRHAGDIDLKRDTGGTIKLVWNLEMNNNANRKLVARQNCPTTRIHSQ